MVWCGVVWCGMVWFGVVWCGLVWFGVVWYGVVWCGVVWFGVVWCGLVCPSDGNRGLPESAAHESSGNFVWGDRQIIAVRV